MENVKYSKFTSSDFILDEDFQSWVNSNDPEQDKFWRDWLSKNPNRSAELDKAREILLAMNFKEEQFSKTQLDEAWDNQLKSKADTTINLSDNNNHRQLKKSKTFLKVAAAVALLVATYFSVTILIPFDSNPRIATITKSVAPGQKLILTLADGTRIKLNAGSTISYPEKFAEDKREIELTGEAFFKVTPNRNAPFIVKTGNVSTTVLGTWFNVKAFPEKDLVYVAVVEGKVRVSSYDPSNNIEAEVFLTKNELATVPKDEGEILVTPFDGHQLLAWRKGILNFGQSEFQDVVSDLERWYGVKFEIDSNKKINPQWRFSGKFENRSLEYILGVFSYPERFSYKIDGNKVLIK